MEITDVVDEARGGSAGAFRKLYESYAPSMGRYINAITKQPGLAEDLVAETFLRVWTQLPTLRESQRFEAWCFRIAHHVAVDAVRARRPEDSDSVLGVIEQQVFRGPSEAAQAIEDRDALDAALAELPEDYREVLVLRFLAGRSTAETAAQMGRGPDAIRALQHRAIIRLRAVIAGRAEGQIAA